MDKVYVCGPIAWCRQVSDELYSTRDIKCTILDEESNLFVDAVERRKFRKGGTLIINMDFKSYFAASVVSMAFAFDMTIIGVSTERYAEEHCSYGNICTRTLLEDNFLDEIEEYIGD